MLAAAVVKLFPASDWGVLNEGYAVVSAARSPDHPRWSEVLDRRPDYRVSGSDEAWTCDELKVTTLIRLAEALEMTPADFLNGVIAHGKAEDEAAVEE